MNKTVLVTGGAGFIGSHTLLVLIESGYRPIVVDNLCNSSYEAIRRVESLTGSVIPFYQVDLLDKEALFSVFQKESSVEAVIHFAGLKAVGESVLKPLDYYRVNLGTTVNLLEVMGEMGVNYLIYSSSATVYGDPPSIPIGEDFPTAPLSPYGQTKLMCEQVIKDACVAMGIRASILRYFNPVGAHPSGRIGEDPQGIPNNLMPFLAQVAVGLRSHLSVFGNDYTGNPDGTCIRDFIHVMDLADGHVQALIHPPTNTKYQIVNLGTGTGHSVLEMVKAFGQAVGRDLPYQIAPRRAGDVPILVANVQKAEEEWGWRAKRTLSEMCSDLWRWQSLNPHGYKELKASKENTMEEQVKPVVQADGKAECGMAM